MKLNEGYTKVTCDTKEKGEIYVRVASGVPRLTPSGKSIRVEVKPERAKYPIAGYIFPDTDVEKIISKAAQDNVTVLIRFEQERKKDVDNAISIDELTATSDEGRKNTVKSCVGVYDVNNGKWIMTPNARIMPERDSEFPELVKCVNYILSPSTQEPVDVDGFFATPKPPVLNRTAPNPVHFDKQQAIISLYYYILECGNKHNLELSEDNIKALCLKMLKLSDKLYELQKGIKDVNINYGDYCHRQSRFYIFRYEDQVSPLNEEALKSFNNWANACYRYYVNLFSWARDVEIS